MHKYTNHIVHYMKELKERGRCYHPLSPKECSSNFIRAHSIQHARLLTKIAENNEIYSLDSSYSNLIKNSGNIDIALVRIREFSTFRGFCGDHDRSLFYPIDKFSFDSSLEHAFLYAYRGLCKTIFTVENTIEMAKEYVKLYGETELSLGHLQSNINSYTNLLFHKRIYDNCLINKNYSEMHYVVFIMESEPNILFSTSLFPVIDFTGEIVQILDGNMTPSLLSVNSVPYGENWAYLISWHETSNLEVLNFIVSLGDLKIEEKLYVDYLFRLVVASDNIAFSPKWWNELSTADKDVFKKYVSDRITSTTPEFNYFNDGVDGMSKWKCTEAFSSSDLNE